MLSPNVFICSHPMYLVLKSDIRHSTTHHSQIHSTNSSCTYWHLPWSPQAQHQHQQLYVLTPTLKSSSTAPTSAAVHIDTYLAVLKPDLRHSTIQSTQSSTQHQQQDHCHSGIILIIVPVRYMPTAVMGVYADTYLVVVLTQPDLCHSAITQPGTQH